MDYNCGRKWHLLRLGTSAGPDCKPGSRLEAQLLAQHLEKRAILDRKQEKANFCGSSDILA